ncbi:MAG TPA: poly-gamma-glutamate synthase PgsB [Candidatus Krumholzibacteria bacterium]|nr:poly-gamma-glutamate synthase PgsB [Candidatus Krumholzibacteria bacterium]HPD72821.1 poly-gamma-glutamate synthase PgsB [Candidatus Krumholzibacteria bacterium]HRY40247.1 poly-gamma-glutamate synthase PgsB [Candidatus Krumholzibacteria bacterium]
MRLIILLLILVVGMGVWETARHRWHLRRIPIRVHVNGSRGKSSVARLIAAGLRGGGLRVAAKTTGSAAAMIHVDGTETPVVRRGGPNIREQLQIVRDAAREGCQALVIECMAVRPDLQHACEHHIVHATHGVITNVRPDHLEVMGPTLEDVAKSLAGTVPRRSLFFHAEDAFADYFAGRARELGSRCTAADASQVTAAEMAGFRYVEFPENVALALNVCMAAGVPRDRALQAMYGVVPDVGAMTLWRFPVDQGTITFCNGFAANDPMSYIRIWDRLGLAERAEQVVLVFNNREDRMRRAKDMLPLFGRELVAGRYVLIGEQTRILGDMLRRQHLPPDRVEDLAGRPAAELWSRLVELTPAGGLVIGVGNIKGIGNALLDHLRDRLAMEVS